MHAVRSNESPRTKIEAEFESNFGRNHFREVATPRRSAASPGVIRSVLEGGNFVGRRPHISDSAASLVRIREQVRAVGSPIRGASHGVFGNSVEISSNEVGERRRTALFIVRVILNRFAHILKVLMEHRFARANDALIVSPAADGGQDHDNHHHDHQLEQRESALPSGRSTRAHAGAVRVFHRYSVPLKAVHYQSEYFFPLSAVPVDFVKTSKTSWPPQEVVSGSSCTDRIPQSFFPVIGSIGILRRKCTRLSDAPASLTPLTRVSRSGG